MYLIRDKKTKKIICDNPAPLSKNLEGKDIHPNFNPKTMELLQTELNDVTGHYDDLEKYYTITAEGQIVEKTLAEKVAAGLVEFGHDLSQYLEIDAEDATATESVSIQLVQLGLKHNLIKTLDHCNIAFGMLDNEFESRTTQKYRPGYETKLMKDYIGWLEEGKPANDKREQKYLKMKASIDKIKAEYKAVRAALKKITTALKEQAS